MQIKQLQDKINQNEKEKLFLKQNITKLLKEEFHYSEEQISDFFLDIDIKAFHRTLKGLKKDETNF